MTSEYKRRFWEAGDVAAWIETNSDDKERPEDQAIWWCAYRDSESISDINTKERARMLQDGWAPYDESNVTDRLQSWSNDKGDEGQLPEIDDEIEADLKEFFNVGS